MGLEVGGLLGLVILLVDIYAIVKILEANISSGSKVVWIALILLLPVLGLIIWLLFGPGGKRMAHG